MKAIFFFGPDGVGKTTQAEMLIRFLQMKKHKVFRVWIRGRHLIAYLISEFLIGMGYYRLVKVPSGLVYKVFDPALTPKLPWSIIEFVSVLPLIFLKVFFPGILGFTIIADRCMVDTIAYLSYWLSPSFLQSFSSNLLLRMIPKNAILIHLDAEIPTLVRRLYDDNSSFNFLVYQRRIYSYLSRQLGAVTIDTSYNSITETFRLVLKVISDDVDFNV